MGWVGKVAAGFVAGVAVTAIAGLVAWNVPGVRSLIGPRVVSDVELTSNAADFIGKEIEMDRSYYCVLENGNYTCFPPVLSKGGGDPLFITGSAVSDLGVKMLIHKFCHNQTEKKGFTDECMFTVRFTPQRQFPGKGELNVLTNILYLTWKGQS